MRPDQVVHSDPEILGGTPVFVGTRVPVRTLIDHLEAGDTIEQSSIPSRPCFATRPLPRSRWPVTSSPIPRILVDESLPVELADEFGLPSVRTVRGMGWAGLKNGELVKRAVLAGFTHLLTAD